MPTPTPAVATQETAQTVNKDAMNRYADIKVEIKRLEDEMEMLKPGVLADVAFLRGDSDSPIRTEEILAKYGEGYGFTTKAGTKKWTYSPETTALIKEVDSKKKKEESQRLQMGTGPATFVEGEPQLVFNTPKKQKE